MKSLIIKSDEEVTAVKAVLFLARSNPRLKYGGTFVEKIHDYENSSKIPFEKAIDIVEKIIDDS